MNGITKLCWAYVITLSNAIEKNVPAQLPKAIPPTNFS